MGLGEGAELGVDEGLAVKPCVGAGVGGYVGFPCLAVGAGLGAQVGDRVGLAEGFNEGCGVGAQVGSGSEHRARAWGEGSEPVSEAAWGLPMDCRKVAVSGLHSA